MNLGAESVTVQPFIHSVNINPQITSWV